MKSAGRKISKYISLIVIYTSLVCPSIGQDLKYDPKGHPDQWNFELIPFILLPTISGEVQSERLSKDFGIGPADFISTLQGVFMLDAEVSKGKFFASPAYIYTYNEVEKVYWTSENGNQTIQASPQLKKNIAELLAGMRFRLKNNFMMDPFVGFRYTSYHVFGSLAGIVNETELDEHADFWDPLIGFQAHYYPHSRILVELKADIGGFGIGSELTWSVMFNSGYSFSPSVDLLAGFAALSNRYEAETVAGHPFGMTSVTYGFDLGVRVYFPCRLRDPAVFKRRQ